MYTLKVHLDVIYISYTLTLKPNLHTESAKLQAHYILYTQFALDTLKTN